jgi:hypothetical protein
MLFKETDSFRRYYDACKRDFSNGKKRGVKYWESLFARTNPVS